MNELDSSQRVLRLRKLPGRITRPREVAKLLGEALGIVSEHIIIYSLATTYDRWENPPSKMATLQLMSVPECMQQNPRGQQWEVPLPGAPGGTLILDAHFEGWTVLNDVEPSKHRTDCIAISGLASHPFGSWQTRGGDKSYMWLRDEIPISVPGVRALLYGYNSALVGGSSFQTISDIALGFIKQLEGGGWNLDSSKPIVFLAHSLGGLVLKEALVQVADRVESVASILDNVQGAIMFGVPSLGMQQSHLMAMVEGQGNDTLVQDLSRHNGTSYLRQLNKSFEGISFTRSVRILWAYETKESRTVVQQSDGTWERNGPPVVLVNPDSATCRYNRKNKAITIPINEDHSNMVKFSRGDLNLGPVLSCLRELCFPHQDPSNPVSSPHVDVMPRSSGGASASAIRPSHRTSNEVGDAIERDYQMMREFDNLWSSLEKLQTDLDSPALNFRIDQIEDPFQDTFQWIFNLPVFCNWLQQGSGLFWIHGKPGSGKSTLMKFIYESPRTWELLHDWKSNAIEIKGSFFFHYRGTAIQKSFEGVLRSLILQILSPHCKQFRNQHEATLKNFRKLAIEKHSLEEEVSRYNTKALKLSAELASLKTGQEQDDSKEKVRRKRIKLDDEGAHPDVRESFGGEAQKEIVKLETDYRGVCHELRHLEILIETVDKEVSQCAARYFPHSKASRTMLLTDIVTHFRDRAYGLIPKLERMLRRLLHQDLISMDLILFFDALDEFEGHLDMISSFIKDLVDKTPSSATRVKVCLSSRPWKTLETHFSTYLNFSLQDYTKPDLESYAATSLAQLGKGNSAFFELIPLIIARANGVFLWARLAVREMVDIVSTGMDIVSRRQLEEKLRRLPDDLFEFYRLIIERISLPTRRRTFALLELLVHESDPPSAADHVRQAVLTADCATFQAAREVLECDGRNAGARKVGEREFNDMSVWGGGLVEIKSNYPQLMHQTVLEFVTGLSFKRIVLGDLAAIVSENGHSFHLKYHIVTWNLPALFTGPEMRHRMELQDKIAHHAAQSELTTGNSHLEFLDSVPLGYLRSITCVDYLLPINKDALLLFVISKGLSLCLRDWIAANPGELARRNLLSDTACLPLLGSLPFSPANGKFCDAHLRIARMLLEGGYRMAQDPGFFAAVLKKLSLPRTTQHPTITESALLELAALVLEYGQDPNVTISVFANGVTTECSALHVAPPCLAADLIQRGANTSARDSGGRTPLDWALSRHFELSGTGARYLECARRYEMCKILLNTQPPSRHQQSRMAWRKALDEFDQKGYDTQALREKLGPEGTTRWQISWLRWLGRR
ncbi:hypothetical protein GQ53DRAFT_715140 [Thozetella sp. PMI_491]|nr:hypothetical protein GQ53DRAFT_715140 [Thozetella sp. PMI_491]